ncbi:hypothetical protein ACLOJK_007314 [Asimina triloba]
MASPSSSLLTAGEPTHLPYFQPTKAGGSGISDTTQTTTDGRQQQVDDSVIFSFVSDSSCKRRRSTICGQQRRTASPLSATAACTTSVTTMVCWSRVHSSVHDCCQPPPTRATTGTFETYKMGKEVEDGIDYIDSTKENLPLAQGRVKDRPSKSIE